MLASISHFEVTICTMHWLLVCIVGYVTVLVKIAPSEISGER